MKDNYTKEAIDNMRRRCNMLVKIMTSSMVRPRFTRLINKVRREKYLVSKREPEVAYKAYQLIVKGDYLDKLHYTSNSKRKEYFAIKNNKFLVRARDKKDIDNPKKVKMYELATIKGLVYGKITPTFLKKKDKDYLPWLCISVMLGKRSLDIYCSETNVNVWYEGLSYAIKKRNPDALAFPVGRYLWLKLKYLIVYLVKSKLSKEQLELYKRKELTFKKALIIFKRLRLDQMK